jgi:hypothetical protein
MLSGGVPQTPARWPAFHAATCFCRSSSVYVFIFSSDIHANVRNLMRPVYLSPEAVKLTVTPKRSQGEIYFGEHEVHGFSMPGNSDESKPAVNEIRKEDRFPGTSLHGFLGAQVTTRCNLGSYIPNITFAIEK